MSLQECPEVQEYLHNHKIMWQFNSPRAPWQGGLLERLISIVKGSLQKVFHKRSVTREELLTTLVEIEAVVNNRPLLYLRDDSRACEALTPSHLLYGRKLKLCPTFDTHDFYYDHLNNIDVLLEYNNKVKIRVSTSFHAYGNVTTCKRYMKNTILSLVPCLQEFLRQERLL